MARGTWDIEKSVANVWMSDGTIYRPNETVELNFLSTQSKLQLANGSNAFVTPETKCRIEPITFRWLEIANSDSFWSKIKAYIVNQNYLKITDHLTQTYIGRFITLRQVWLSGVDDTYDIEAVFEVME